MKDFGMFYCHLAFFGLLLYLLALWYSLLSFVIFLPSLICCHKKNLATLIHVLLEIVRVIVGKTFSILPKRRAPT
jgi:hypothetical protein